MAIKEQEAFGSVGVFMGIVAKEGTGNVNWQGRKKTEGKWWSVEDLKGTAASPDKCFCLPCLLPEYPAGKQELGFQAEGNVSFTGAA